MFFFVKTTKSTNFTGKRLSAFISEQLHFIAPAVQNKNGGTNVAAKVTEVASTNHNVQEEVFQAPSTHPMALCQELFLL